MFERRLIAGWGDMDFNSHMRNTAFLDKSADVRMMFFAANGFPMEEFIRLKLGPVITKDELEYYREVRLLEELRVTLCVRGLAEDGSRFLMRNEFWSAPGDQLVARVTSAGGWLDLEARRLVVPPEGLVAAMRLLPRTDDFQVIPSVRK
jgi:acyl-CoA thioester hydrolase